MQEELEDLAAALRHHRRTVESFQQSVAQLDNALASTMQFLSSWIDRLERVNNDTRNRNA